MEKFVFATNYNESDEFLKCYVDNFLHYTDDSCRLIINYPPNREINPEIARISDRVHLINGKSYRGKWGPGLSFGHLESYAYAAAYLENFDYFITTASNCLFFRPFSPGDVIEHYRRKELFPLTKGRDYRADFQIPSEGHPGHGTWAWQGYNQSPHFKKHLQENLRLNFISVTQIEGLIISRNDWDMILGLSDELYGMAHALAQDPDDPRNYMAIEEMIFSTLVLERGSGHFSHICFMLWDGLARITPPMLMRDLPQLPPHICTAKWFDREVINPSVAILGTAAGREMMRHFLSDRYSRTTALVQMQNIIESFIAISRSDAENLPFSTHWTRNERWSGHHAFNERFTLDRNRITVLDINPTLPDNGSCFFFCEGGHTPFNLVTHFTDRANRLDVMISGVNVDTPSDTALAGYLYLPSIAAIDEFSLTTACQPDARKTLDRIVLHDGLRNYFIVSPHKVWEQDGRLEAKYFLGDYEKSRPIHVGIPCFGASPIHLSLSIPTARP